MSSQLLSLPRELRDIIYHHLFLSGYVLKALLPASPTIYNIPSPDGGDADSSLHASGRNVYMHSKARYRLPLSVANTQLIALPWEFTDPVWLLTCRTIFLEGMAQLARNAEWICDDDDLQSTPRNYAPCVLTLPVQKPRISHLEIRIKDDEFHTYDDDLAILRPLADLMRQNKVECALVRLVVATTFYTFLMPEWIHNWGSSDRRGLFTTIAKTFQGVSVETWQLAAESFNPRRSSWTIYEWKGDMGFGEIEFREISVPNAVEALPNLKLVKREVESCKEDKERMSEVGVNEKMDYRGELTGIFVTSRGNRKEGVNSMKHLRDRRQRVAKLREEREMTERFRLEEL